MTGSVLPGRLVQRRLQKLRHNFHSRLLRSLHPLSEDCRPIVALAVDCISGKFPSPVHLELRLRHAVDVINSDEPNLCMSQAGRLGSTWSAGSCPSDHSSMLCLRDVLGGGYWCSG